MNFLRTGTIALKFLFPQYLASRGCLVRAFGSELTSSKELFASTLPKSGYVEEKSFPLCVLFCASLGQAEPIT